MTRLEQVTARALKRFNDDRYLLSCTIFERTKELSKGAKPLVPMDAKKHKFSDIAIHEIAEGLIEINSVEDRV